jgi:nucleotide-binding universal stress UspA family protein
MKRILVAVDLSEDTDRILDFASKIAKTANSKMCIVHSESFDYYVSMGEFNDIPQPELRENRMKAVNSRLTEIRKKMENANIETISILLEGPTAANIIEAAEQFEADLIIVGSHKHGRFYNLLIGSTHDALIKKSTIPVLVVPPRNFN